MPHNKLKHARALRAMDRIDEARVVVLAGLDICPAEDCDARGALIAFLGQLDRDQGWGAKAIEHYKEAYITYTEGGNQDRAVHTLRHIADIEAELGLHDEARRNYDIVIKAYRSNPSTLDMDMANALRGYALLLEKMHENQIASDSWKEALSIYRVHGISAGVDECQMHLRQLKG